MNKKIIAAVAVVAAAIVCIAVAIGIKFSASDKLPAAPVAGTAAPSETTENNIYTLPAETTTEKPEETETSAVTSASEETSVTEKVTELTNLVNKAFSEVFTLPKAPKYIPPAININFDKAKLASYKYDPDGN